MAWKLLLWIVWTPPIRREKEKFEPKSEVDRCPKKKLLPKNLVFPVAKEETPHQLGNNDFPVDPDELRDLQAGRPVFF